MTQHRSGDQGRGSNLSEEDRRRGGETSSREQGRDDQGQWSGTTGGTGKGTGGSSDMGQGYGNKGGQGMTGGQGHSGGQGGQGHSGGQGGSMPRDDQGQWKSPQSGDKGNNPGGSHNR